MTSKASSVLISRDGPVTTIQINRPDRRNAVDHKTSIALREAFQEFEDDEQASVAVLGGAGDHFCAGYDLKSLATDGMPYEAEGVGPMGPSRMLLSKPVIAAVEGYAVAGGLELALWCDLRVASSTAIFGVYCRRWGVPLIDGGTVRLPRLIGHSRALDMILTGRSVPADEALGIGLANRLVEPGVAVAAAQVLALDISRFPQICTRVDRMSSYQQWGQPLAAALAYEGREGERPLLAEARGGAGRFSAGKGRAGDFSEI